MFYYEKRISELKRKIETCNEYKERSLKYYNHINRLFDEWKISHIEHDRLIRETFHNKPIEYWINYYNNKIKSYEKEIQNYEFEISAEKSTKISPILIISLFAITLLLTLIIGLRFTGFTVYEPGQELLDNVSETIVNQTITDIKESINVSINESLEVSQLSIEEEIIQGEAEVNKPVKWTRKIKLNETNNSLTVKLPDKISDIRVKKIVDGVKEDISSDKFTINNIQQETELNIKDVLKEIEIEYYTEPPKFIEEQINEHGKEIVVSSDIHYQNIIVYSNVTESKKGTIKLFRTTGGIKEEFKIDNYYDTNNNGLIDQISWLISSLSNQSYVIEIIKAEHLDQNKNLISNVYEEVKALDNIWSETIPSEHYIRVTFERNLTSEKDIIIYPRVISGNPKIEVYEFNKTELIATFDSLISNEYNKIFLNNLISESQDVFELKIVNGEVQIDHIVDPVQLFFEDFESGNLNNWVNTALWAVATDQKDGGTYSAKCTGANDCDMNLATALNTIYGSSVNLTLRFRDDDLDGAGDAPVYFNDSSGNWDVIGELDDAGAGEDTWLTLTFNSSDSQYFHTGFNIRFATTLDGAGGAENLWIDNINVSYIVETTKPNFTLKSPEDIFNTSSSLIIFNQSVSDNIALSNVSLFGNWTGSYIRNQTNSTGLNNADYFFNITLNTNGNYIWAYEACDPSNNCNLSNNFTLTFDNTGPSVTASNVNQTSVNVNDYICVNATATDTFLPISVAWVMTTNTSGGINNITMSDTGPYCSKNANDNIYGVNIQLTSSGNYYVNTTYANDTLNNLGSQTISTQVSVTSSNVAPVILDITDLGSPTITEGGVKNILFYSVINDNDGASTISNVNGTFFRSGESLRSNLSCVLVSNLNSTAGNFSCTVPIWFYDVAAIWEVNVTANDTSNSISNPYNESFTLQETVGMNATLTSITFTSSAPDTFNVTSDNDPDTIQNTGNKNNTQIQVKAISLIGDNNNATNIPAANFSVSIVTGSNLECYTTWSNQTTSLINNTAVSIANATLLRSASATRNLYFCLMHIPLNVTAQTYSTLGGGAWTIQVI